MIPYTGPPLGKAIHTGHSNKLLNTSEDRFVMPDRLIFPTFTATTIVRQVQANS